MPLESGGQTSAPLTGQGDSITRENDCASRPQARLDEPKTKICVFGSSSLVSGNDQTSLDKSAFDFRFFALSTADAEFADPQLRLSLEVVYHALVDAGFRFGGETKNGCRIAVLAASCGSDYLGILTDSSRPEKMTGAENLFGQRAMLANRIAHFFGFGGPSFTVDSTCSSGLTALGLACQMMAPSSSECLRNDGRSSNEIDAAVVVGSSVLLDPKITESYAACGMLSMRKEAVEGCCKPFQAAADGYKRTEGVCALVIGRQQDRGPNPIFRSPPLADILGWSMNSNGGGEAATGLKSATNSNAVPSIVCPSATAQARLIRNALARADVHPDDVEYVECHGTGTRAGDAAECAALEEVFGGAGKRNSPLLVGSEKAAIGHTEAAAGLFGVSAVLRAYSTGKLAPTKGYSFEATRNREIPLLRDPSRGKVVEAEMALAPNSRNVCGVSSFSFGGSNAFVLLGKSGTDSGEPAAKATTVHPQEAEPWLFINPVCGRSERTVATALKSLSSKGARFAELLRPPEVNAAVHGGEGRCFGGAGSFDGALGFSACDGTENVDGEPRKSAAKKPPLGVVFSGNGWILPDLDSVGIKIRELCSTSAVWREAWAKCRDYLRGKHNFNLDFDSDQDQCVVRKTVVLAAVQICQVEMLKAMVGGRDGIDFYLGHSAGETAMGYLDGALTLEQTLSIAFIRGRLAAETVAAAEASGAGEMGMSVISGVSSEVLRHFHTDLKPSSVDFAAENHAEAVTFAGPVCALEEFAANVNAKLSSQTAVASGNADGNVSGIISVKKLETEGVAYHCCFSWTDEIVGQFRAAISEIVPEPKEADLEKWISTSADFDQLQDEAQHLIGADYYCRSVRHPVEFWRACSRIPADAVVIELGVGPLLTSCVQRNCPAVRACLPFFPKQFFDSATCDGAGNNAAKEGAATLAELQRLYGNLFLHGLVPKLRPDNLDPACQRHLAAVLRGSGLRAEDVAVFDHAEPVPVLTKQTRIDQGPVHSELVTLSFSDLHGADAWLKDHKIVGKPVVPGAAYVLAAWTAALGSVGSGVDLGCVGVAHRPSVECAASGKSVVVLRNVRFVRRLEIEDSWEGVRLCVRSMQLEGGGSGSRGPATFSWEVVAKVVQRRGREKEEVVSSGEVVARGEFVVVGQSGSRTEFSEVISEQKPYNCRNAIEDFYRGMRTRGLDYGPAFQVRQFANATSASVTSGARSLVPFLDSLLQCAVAEQRPLQDFCTVDDLLLGAGDGSGATRRVPLPIGIDEIVLNCCDADRIACRMSGVRLQDIAIEPPAGADSDTLGDIAVVSREQVLDPIPTEDRDRAAIKTAVNSKSVRVHFVPADAFAGPGRPELDSLVAAFRSESSTTGNDCLVSAAPGLPGFVRSLVKEGARYKGIRGICCLRGEPPENQIPNKLAEAVQQWFSAAADPSNLDSSDACKVADDADDVVLYYDTSNQQLFRETLRPQPHPEAFPTSSNGLYLARIPGDSRYCFKAYPPQDSRVKNDIEVSHAGLNFRDLLLAKGILSKEEALLGASRCRLHGGDDHGSNGLGLEFAGTNVQGEKVIGVARNAIATHLSSERDVLLQWVLPADLPCRVDAHVTNRDKADCFGLEAFATVPVAYATVYLAFFLRGSPLKKTDRVLIHAASGSVGLAAIFVCLHYLESPRDQIFVTCHPAKKDRLLELVNNRPGAGASAPERMLDPAHVASSRDCADFLHMVRRGCPDPQAGGSGILSDCGVDVVLNSLAGIDSAGRDFILHGLECLRGHSSNGGRFLDLGKRGSRNLDTSLLNSGEKSFHVVDLDQAVEHPETRDRIHELVRQGLSNGEVVPLPRAVFETLDHDRGVAKAFEELRNTDERIGKVLLDMRGMRSKEPDLPASLRFSPADNVLVVGGVGDFGWHLAKWLIRKGCRNLTLAGHTRKLSEEELGELQKLAENNKDGVGPCNVFSTTDFKLVDLDQVEKLLDKIEAETSRPVTHFFHLAGRLSDGLFDKRPPVSVDATPEGDQTGSSQWADVVSAKAAIAENFHAAFENRRFGAEVKFILFSSVVAALGNPGQTNYAYANSCLDQLARRRQRNDNPGCQRHALSIQWGLVDGVGMAKKLSIPSSTSPLRDVLAPQSVERSLTELEKLMISNSSGVFAVYSPKAPKLASASSSEASNAEMEISTIVENILRRVPGGRRIEASVVDLADCSLAELGMDSLAQTQIEALLESTSCKPPRFAQLGKLSPRQIAQQCVFARAGAKWESVVVTDRGRAVKSDSKNDLHVSTGPGCSASGVAYSRPASDSTPGPRGASTAEPDTSSPHQLESEAFTPRSKEDVAANALQVPSVTPLPTRFNENGFAMAYPKNALGEEIFVYCMHMHAERDADNGSVVDVRIHSECLTGDVFQSSKCDCGPQFSRFLNGGATSDAPRVLIYVKGHEGRGCGLHKKMEAYGKMADNADLDHVEALRQVGCRSDSRSYVSAVEALKDVLRRFFKCSTASAATCVKLHTNNPDKKQEVRSGLEAIGLCAEQMEAVAMPAMDVLQMHNAKYLEEKQRIFGHDGLGIGGGSTAVASHQSSEVERNSVCFPMSSESAAASQKQLSDSDVKAKAFYDEHGWVVGEGFFSAVMCQKMILEHDELRVDIASKISVIIPGITSVEYKNEISQHRDLHLIEGSAFQSVVHGDDMRKAVLNLTGWTGCQLLHDHVICKPRGGSNGVIPWHQDSMFWPVDRPGVSVLVALDEVLSTGGCLEVLDRSHVGAAQSGSCNEPVDFMDTEKNVDDIIASSNAGGKEVKHLRLPLKAGSAIFLNSVTYHRSAPNRNSSQTVISSDRPVYLTLWVPRGTCWRPDLVPWHPINHWLESAEIERKKPLPEWVSNEHRHPAFGDILEQEESPGSSAGLQQQRFRKQIHGGTRHGSLGITMYNASDKVAQQLREICCVAGIEFESASGCVEMLSEILSPAKSTSSDVSKLEPSEEACTREKFFQTLYRSACVRLQDRDKISKILQRLHICVAAYKVSKARNVFNEAYAEWWKGAGERWETRMESFPTTSRKKVGDEETFLTKDEVKAYLRRIGVSVSTIPTLSLLTEIVEKSMARIPFQNFSLLTAPRVRLTKAEIVNAMVSGIGGLCSVRNPFLFLLLKALGFEDVNFVSCTISEGPAGKPLPNAHIALTVAISGKLYWVDIGNGHPYMLPLELSSDPDPVVLHAHSSIGMSVRVKLRAGWDVGDKVYEVQHRQRLRTAAPNGTSGEVLNDTCEWTEWTTNNFFSVTPVPFSHFDSLHFQHYNPSPEFEGPFLKSLRLNLWNAATGEFIVLRNQEVKFAVKNPNGASAEELVTTSTDCSTYEELRHLVILTQLFQEQGAALPCYFESITNIMKLAWTQIVGDHPTLAVQETVVVMAIGEQNLCREAGKLFCPRTEEMLQAVAKQTHRASAVWVVIDGVAKDEDFEMFAELEREARDLFLKVSPAWKFELQPGAIDAGRSGSPRVNVVRNSRTKDNKLGAWNWGNMQSLHHFSSNSADPFVAFVDPMTARCWRPDFLRCCIIEALCDENPSPERADVVMSSTGHLALTRQSTLLQAGLFDEAFSGRFDGCSHAAEADLLIRLLDLGVCARRVDIAPLLETSSRVDNDDVAYFWYKHGIRKGNFPAKVRDIVDKYLEGPAPTADSTPDVEAEAVPFEMMNGEHMFLRRETLHIATSDISKGSPRPTMLVGVITSNLDRIRGLLSDLGCMLADAKHCVVVFANVAEEGPAASNSFVARLKRLLESYRFRSRVLTSADVFAAFAGQSFDATTDENADAAPEFPLPIAAARTVLQTSMLAITQEVENRFEFAAVIDDDMRLPSFWGNSLGKKCLSGDIFLSRALKTPPNPTFLSIRTQLVDFLHALDKVHFGGKGRSESAVAAKKLCDLRPAARNLQDVYYDLSSSRFDHLEMPRPFSTTLPDACAASFVTVCRRKILVGDPLARETVSMEEDGAPSMQRGGCMVLPSKSFSLLGSRQDDNVPLARLASGKVAAVRRSDTFWVQRHCGATTAEGVSPPMQAVVHRALAIFHDNTHDEIPTAGKMRETVALEIIGAVLCRMNSKEQAGFMRERLAALRCSVARIRGICATLRNRPYFRGKAGPNCGGETVPGLHSFVDFLEDLCDDERWEDEVYRIVEENLEGEWRSQAEKKQQDKAQERLPHPIHYESLLPVACLHRIHADGDTDSLSGAHSMQKRIGMSLPVSEVEARLRATARLVERLRTIPRQGVAGVRAAEQCGIHQQAALITFDDGFRDVLLLRELFRNIPKRLVQPVMFVPSSLLQQVSRRHLPLVCLYQHCHNEGIEDPDDAIRLGSALVTRRNLKIVSEEMQYSLLERHGIPILEGEEATQDLLTLADLRLLASEGWIIGTHGPDHSDLVSSCESESDRPSWLHANLREDCDVLRRRFGAQGAARPWFAWPEGKWNFALANHVAQACRDGVVMQFGLFHCDEGPHPRVTPRVIWNGNPRRRIRVLVTGSEGFLGQYLCDLLEAYGSFDVFRTDITRSDERNYGKCDILDETSVKSVMEEFQVQACVHLAAVADLNIAKRDPEAARRINVEGTRNVLKCCDELGVRLLFASTCCAYGNNGASICNEESTLDPTDVYAQTKVEGEKLVAESSKHVILRLATFYGPGQRSALATAVFLRKSLNQEPIRIHGSGAQTRCFTHVHDIAEGIRVVLQTPDFTGVVNIADDRECSVNELAEVCMRAVGNRVEVVPGCGPSETDSQGEKRESGNGNTDREGQILRSRICNQRLRAMGWRPVIQLETGLAGCAAALLQGEADIDRSDQTQSHPNHQLSIGQGGPSTEEQPSDFIEAFRPNSYPDFRASLPLNPGLDPAQQTHNQASALAPDASWVLITLLASSPGQTSESCIASLAASLAPSQTSKPVVLVIGVDKSDPIYGKVETQEQIRQELQKMLSLHGSVTRGNSSDGGRGGSGVGSGGGSGTADCCCGVGVDRAATSSPEGSSSFAAVHFVSFESGFAMKSCWKLEKLAEVAVCRYKADFLAFCPDLAAVTDSFERAPDLQTRVEAEFLGFEALRGVPHGVGSVLLMSANGEQREEEREKHQNEDSAKLSLSAQTSKAITVIHRRHLEIFQGRLWGAASCANVFVDQHDAGMQFLFETYRRWGAVSVLSLAQVCLLGEGEVLTPGIDTADAEKRLRSNLGTVLPNEQCGTSVMYASATASRFFRDEPLSEAVATVRHWLTFNCRNEPAPERLCLDLVCGPIFSDSNRDSVELEEELSCKLSRKLRQLADLRVDSLANASVGLVLVVEGHELALPLVTKAVAIAGDNAAICSPAKVEASDRIRTFDQCRVVHVIRHSHDTPSLQSGLDSSAADYVVCLGSDFAPGDAFLDAYIGGIMRHPMARAWVGDSSCRDTFLGHPSPASLRNVCLLGRTIQNWLKLPALSRIADPSGSMSWCYSPQDSAAFFSELTDLPGLDEKGEPQSKPKRQKLVVAVPGARAWRGSVGTLGDGSPDPMSSDQQFAKRIETKYTQLTSSVQTEPSSYEAHRRGSNEPPPAHVCGRGPEASEHKGLCGAPRPQRFVILAFPRTGSNLLCSILKNHDEVHMWNELYHSREVKSESPCDLDAEAMMALRESNPTAFMDRMFDPDSLNLAKTHPTSTISAIGFKLLPENFFCAGAVSPARKRLLTSLLGDPSVKKIILKRENLLAVHVSQLRAVLSGSFRSKILDDVKIKVDVADFQRFMEEYHDVFRFYEEICDSREEDLSAGGCSDASVNCINSVANASVFHVSYADLEHEMVHRDGRTLKPLLDFLGVRSNDVDVLRKCTDATLCATKQSQLGPASAIVNEEGLRYAFRYALHGPWDQSSPIGEPNLTSIATTSPRPCGQIADLRKATTTGKFVGVIAFYFSGRPAPCDQLCRAPFLGNYWDLRQRLGIPWCDSPDRGIVLNFGHFGLRTFWNSEAAYQALKFHAMCGLSGDDSALDPRFAATLDRFERSSGEEAFALRSELLETAGRGSNLESDKRKAMMLSVLRGKFAPGSELAVKLLETGDSFLLEHTSTQGRDRLWSDNVDGTGENMLGFQLMLIRDELRENKTKASSQTSAGSTGWLAFLRDPCVISWKRMVSDASQLVLKKL